MKTGFIAAALAAFTTVVIDAGGSKAAIFTVGGQDYDVTTFTGSYNSNVSKFATSASGGVMPWFGNLSLASSFANVVGASLGLHNLVGYYGPFFAYSAPPSGSSRFWDSTAGAVQTLLGPDFTSSLTFAQAVLVPPPSSAVPGPLPLFGAAAAFGMSRRLRRRIATQSHKL